MSRFAQYVRQSFSGAAATVALAAGMAAAPAQAQFKHQVPQLHPTCVTFNNHVARPSQQYDVPLVILAQRITSYSGWAALQDRMKAAGHDLQGLCPNLRTPPPVVPAPLVKGFAVNIMDPSTRGPVNPEIFTKLAKAGALDNIVDTVIQQATSLSLTNENDPLFPDDQDVNARILLSTVLKIYVQTESLFAAIESAVEDKNTTVLKITYAENPELIADISDLHAQAIVAHAQKRTLSEDEKIQFRNKMLTNHLQDPDVRAFMAASVGETMANAAKIKMIEDAGNGRTVTAPVYKPFDNQDIASKLARFPGNVANLDAVKNYKSYWDAEKAKGQDPVSELEDFLSKLPEMAQDLEKRRQNIPTPPSRRFIPDA